MAHDAASALAAVWRTLGGAGAEPDRLTVTGPARVLPSAHGVTTAGVAAVGASLLAGRDGPVGLDTRQLAVALRSERHLRVDGRAPGTGFAPLSAFHRTADGWIRLHGNYPWHRDAALRVLGCSEPEAPAAIAGWPGTALEDALHAAGGVGAAVRTARRWRTEQGGPAGLVERRVLGDAPPRPARRPRVLDLTRVIAGPVGTRTLAVHGADVLRVDPPDRPEIDLQWRDTLPGKRSALLDLRRAGPREALLAGADVVVTGYRPGALDAFGLAPEELAQRHPGLVVATLSAWDPHGPWAARRGFDSIVQAACGIAVAEGSADAPGALPAQVLDHATGYLLAAGVLLALRTQRRDGGSHHLRFSLAGTADWLTGLPAEDGPVADVDPAAHLQRCGDLTVAAPPGAVAGEPLRFPGPAPSFGTAAASWAGR
jgi:hypothetical protein